MLGVYPAVLDFCSLRNVMRPSNAVFASLALFLFPTYVHCSGTGMGSRSRPKPTLEAP